MAPAPGASVAPGLERGGEVLDRDPPQFEIPIRIGQGMCETRQRIPTHIAKHRREPIWPVVLEGAQPSQETLSQALIQAIQVRATDRRESVSNGGLVQGTCGARPHRARGDAAGTENFPRRRHVLRLTSCRP